MRRLLVTVLVLALLVATTAAFTLTEALKLELSPVTAPRFDKRFSPTCECATSTARLSLRLRERATVDAVIVDGEGVPVRTLATDVERPRGQVVFRWNGRDDAGDVVPDGRYRLRIHLEEQRRTIVIPNPIRIDTDAPELELVAWPRGAFSPDGDGRKDRIRIRYRASEASRPLLFVDGVLALEGRTRARGTAKVIWGGRFEGDLGDPGTRRLTLRVRDRAGNVSDPVGPIRVRVRYVELTSPVYRVRRGGVLRFRVLTDAASFAWRLAGRGGRMFEPNEERKRVAVPLPAAGAFGPGRYALRVEANGYSDRAVVHIVRRRR